MDSTLSSFFETAALIDRRECTLVQLIAAADKLRSLDQSAHAVLLYKYWLLANPTSEFCYAAAFNCGTILLAERKYGEAQAAFVESIKAKPDFSPAHVTLAVVAERMGNVPAALTALRDIVAAHPGITREAILHRVFALKTIARLSRNTAQAEAALREAVELDATQAEILQHWVNNRQARCIWPAITPVGSLSVAEIRQRLAPLSASMSSDDPGYVLAAGRTYFCAALEKEPAVSRGGWLPYSGSRPEKLKIAYLSSDLCNHAIGYLMSDVFQNHDRTRYEIAVYNIGERTNDPLQLKAMRSVDRWVDIKDVPDRQAAKQIIADDVHVLLDINGHTNYQRTRLLAYKPAPIIANWLGYPGTMGSDFHDYIIADDFIIPESHETFYSEKVIRLPVYQPNGQRVPLATPKLSRTELGLPEQGFVFCCFNGAIKITAEVFARWMLILRSVPGSVLWLRGSADDAHKNLQAAAAKQGVAPERLIVLPFQSNTEYLACHRYADLFLDTFPYGAHTTASDALRAGVPIVTLAGNTFASRVCGSLVSAAGIPELVCRTPRAYIEKAIALGNDAVAFQQIKQKLAEALPSSPLFDAPLLVKNLEGLFDVMWDDYCAGRLISPQLIPTVSQAW